MKKNTTDYLKKLKSTFLFSIILGCNVLHAQSGNVDLAFGKPVLTLGDSSRFNDDVRAILIQPDGNAIVAGKFTHYNGISNSYNGILRLTPGGNIDASFIVSSGFNAFSEVNTLAIQTDGKILAGGSFSTYNTIACGKIARINSNGSADLPFLLNIGNGFNNNVNAISIQDDGKIIAAGAFTMFNTTPCNYIVRLDSTGAVDTTFNTGLGFNYEVTSIAIQPDGKIIAGGYFNSYDTIASVGHICRLNTDGTIDSIFLANSSPGFNSNVTALTIQPDGKIIAGGDFNSYNSIAINKVARIDSTGLPDTSFATGSVFASINYPVTALLLQNSGNIIVCGDTALVSGGIVCLNSNGALNNQFLSNYGGFTGGALGVTYALANESNGNILFGGSFTQYNNTSRKKIGEIYPDGWLSDSYNVYTGFAYGSVYKIALQPDGKILAGGYQTINYNGTNTYGLVRIMSQDGDIDTSFHFNQSALQVNDIVFDTIHSKIIVGGLTFGGPGIYRLNLDGTPDTLFLTGSGFNNEVKSICVQPDGKIIVAGAFTSYNNTPVNHIVRLDEFGVLDVIFNNNSGSGCNTFLTGDVVLLPGGKILAVGSFTTFNSNSCGHIVRINSDGSYDNTFQSGTGFSSFGMAEIALQADGKMVITGPFLSYNGNSCGLIVRIDTSGSYDNTFNGAFGGPSLAIQPDGKIVVAYINTGLRRMNTDGTVDNSFVQGTTSNSGTINTIVIQSDDKILAGGGFYDYNNYIIRGIVRLYNTITAVNEISRDDLFSVSPNPSNGAVRIKFFKPFREPFMVTLTNAYGQQLRSFKLKEDQQEIYLNQPSGIYFITLQNPERCLTKKIILQ